MNKKNIFISMFALTLAVLSWMPVNAQQNVRDLRGDVNYDDEVDINDATDLIDYILTGDWGGGSGVQTADYYADKVFGVIGDSFTQANKWQKRMCDNLGARLIEAGDVSVGGVSGGRYSGDPETQSETFAIKQAQNLYNFCVANNVTPDYILVCDGTNDLVDMWSDGGNQFGLLDPYATVNDIGNTESAHGLIIDKAHKIAGMQATFLYLMDKFPDATILVSNTPGGWFHSQGYDSWVRCFEENLKMVCKFYGIEYLDAYYCVPVSAANTAGGHPTDIGHQRIGDFMASLLLSRLR